MSVEGTIECCCVNIKCLKENFVLLNIYRPPNKSQFLEFIEVLDKILSQLKNNFDAPIVLCGDLNIDNLTNSWEKDYLLDTLDSYNLNITARVATRVTESTCSQLDYIITDFQANKYMSNTMPPLLSDHCILTFKIFLEVKGKLQQKIEKRRINKTNLDLFERLIYQQRWPIDSISKSVDELFEEFYATFLYIFDICFPKAVFNIKDDSQVKWITNDVMRSQDNVKELYWRTRGNHNYIDKNIKMEYKVAKRNYDLLLQNTKKQFYRTKIENAKNISKESWKIVKNLTCDDHTVYSSCNINLKINDELITNPSSVANIFNNFFVEEVLKLAGGDNADEQEICCGVNEDFHLWPATEDEVRQVIEKVSSKTGAGIDEVPCSILKYCKEAILIPLTMIINKSLTLGCFPSRLKTSKVVPIPKNNEREQTKNYRPVSIQSVFSKIFEIIFLTRLSLYLSEKQILTSQQFGFRKNHSTIDAIVDLLIVLHDKLDTLGESLCFFYDMTKAFDLISHQNLLKKLKKLGFDRTSLNWISTYLLDRHQVVNIRHSSCDGLIRHYCSSLSPALNTGVPQGSNLGPILFLLYVNDLPSMITEGRVWLFADDISQLIHGEDDLDLRKRAQRGLIEMSEWCNSNELLLNKGKTSVLKFYNRNKPDCLPLLKLHGKSIAINDSTKYLGIHISSNLRWQKQVEEISTRLTSVCYMMRRLAQVVDQAVLMKVYYGCFNSIMNYGIVIWGGSPLAERIFLLQKRIVRIICNAPYLAHCSPLFLQLNILTLPAMFILESALLVKRKPETFVRNEEIHHYQTRQAKQVHVPQVASALAKSGPKFSSINIYNNVPEEIRRIQDETKFKAALKKFLLKRPLYTLEEFFSR